MLDTEQQDFAELAAYVFDKKKNAGSGVTETENAESVEDSGKREEVEILQEYQELVLENPDFAGWIVIDDTVINYPIMQTPGEIEYYLHRDFKGQDSYAGMPFMGSGNLQKEAELLQYQKKPFWAAHPVVHLDNLYEHRKYRLFSVFHADETEWYGDDRVFSDGGFGSSMTRDKYIEILRKRGLHENNVLINHEASLLFLVTCSYEKDNSCLVVAAVRVK